jgi:hypothetical protein
VGVLDRFERGIEKAVNGVFARAFKSEVQPVEIASALRRAMDDRAAVVGRGRTLVPNAFVVELGHSDYARLSEYADVLAEELIANVTEHAEAQQYAFPGPVTIALVDKDDLDTGVFQVRSSTVRGGAAPQGYDAGPAYTPREAPQPAPAMPPGEIPTPSPDWAAAGAGGGVPGAFSPPAPPVAPPPVAVPPVVAPPASGPAPVPGAARFPVQFPGDLHPGDAADPVDPGHQPAPVQQGPPAAHPAYQPVARRPWLDVDGHAYPLLGAVTVVGRGDDADVVLDDPGVSRRHAEVRVTTDGPHLVAHLRDLGSTNGTFVDGNRVTGARLVDGNSITMGRTRLTFRSGER